MSEIVNPFALPDTPSPEPPETLPTAEDVIGKAMELVQTVTWANESPDGAPTYVQNRLVFAQATTTVGEMCDLEDPESVRRCISAYFEMCKMNSTDPSLPGLANALGRDSKWLKSMRDPGKPSFYNVRPLLPEVKNMIAQALRVLDQLFAQLILDGRISPAAAQQLGANHFEYVNKVEHKLDVATREEPTRDIDEIAAEFAKLPILDVEYTEVK